jgi:hypothetical protein
MRKGAIRLTPIFISLVSGVFTLLPGLVWAHQSLSNFCYENSDALPASRDPFSAAVYENQLALVYCPETTLRQGVMLGGKHS